MPANRAILADISERGLDHRVAYRTVGAAGRLKVRDSAVDQAAAELTSVIPSVSEVDETTQTPEVVEVDQQEKLVESHVVEPVVEQKVVNQNQDIPLAEVVDTKKKRSNKRDY
jgi:hypothetical protein